MGTDTTHGVAEPELEECINRVYALDLPNKLWEHSLDPWSRYSQEAKHSIASRLGWLDAPALFTTRISELNLFAKEVANEGFTSVAVLGMGGSSLCVEVLRDILGVSPGYPELFILDSTHPDQIADLGSRLDLKHTLFVISSKSGSTLEPNCYFDYFWGRVAGAVSSDIGSHFVAITDPGSDLEKLALDKKFRRAFLNPADIGGRFSVLSYFGLLPAALIGIDLKRLLGATMEEAARTRLDAVRNDAVQLGAAMASAALLGRDKLTILTSKSLSSFGYWAEQLIAESTGKEGKGILPVEGEGRLNDRLYGDDRFFVSLSLANEAVDSPPAPNLTITLHDTYELGAQFFRWEFATAVAGWLIGINPFDEPNVTESKQNTNRVLAESTVAEGGPSVLPESDLAAQSAALWRFLDSKVKPHSYVALMAYVARNNDSIEALQSLRLRITKRYNVPATVGFGPRFLHSTGQLHKGGPKEGVFVQFTDTPKHDLAIPEKPFTFGKLIAAQAEGDAESLRAKGRPLLTIRLESADGLLRLIANEV